MPDRNKLLLAVAGKGVERGIDPDIQEDIVILRYTEPTDERVDNLHKQAIRSLIERIAPDWKIHISSLGESGFAVEVRPRPGTKAYTTDDAMVDNGTAIPGTDEVNGEEDKLGLITKQLEALTEALKSAS